ncbi:Immunoglobulin, partial [Oryctes borbonicus]
TSSGICVKINNLQVPEVIRHGSPAVLDCDFSLEPLGDDELVVKWYKNKTLVYQWIPARRPVGLGILKGRLNLAYAASEQNYSVHRALHILKSGPDLSGAYTCSVSTLKNEDERTKTMLVFG